MLVHNLAKTMLPVLVLTSAIANQGGLVHSVSKPFAPTYATQSVETALLQTLAHVTTVGLTAFATLVNIQYSYSHFLFFTSYPAMCTDPCVNGGNCTAPDTCTCDEVDWTGAVCSQRKLSRHLLHNLFLQLSSMFTCMWNGWFLCYSPQLQLLRRMEWDLL